MSTPSLAGGMGALSGFTRLCKGLAVVLMGGHIVVQLLPVAVTYLALIPARTIPFVWNLVTSGYIEQSVHGVIISTLGLLFIGKLLEPVWGSREFLKFIFVVNFLTSICIFITAIALYYITRKETYLYMPLSGFHGVLSGFLVGIKQMIPDQELPLLKIKAKWLPSLSLLVSIALSFWTAESATYLPILIFGTYMSWIYLRYWQRKPETKIKGDPSEDFAFSTFFPEFLRPQSLILFHLYSIGCFAEDMKPLMKRRVIPWEGPHCLDLTPLRHLEGGKEEQGHWKRDWQLRDWVQQRVQKIQEEMRQRTYNCLGCSQILSTSNVHYLLRLKMSFWCLRKKLFSFSFPLFL